MDVDREVHVASEVEAVGSGRERSLALRTERMLAWLRILGGGVGIVLTVTDTVQHPGLEFWIEVVSLALFLLVGIAALVWLDRGPRADALRRGMWALYAFDAVILLAQAPLHAFTQLEAPSPALLVPLLGAVRFGYVAAVPGIVAVAGAFTLRGVISVTAYDGALGADAAIVSIVLALVLGVVVSHLYETAADGRARADAATAEAEAAADQALAATDRTAALHAVLADGVGGGVTQVATRLAATVRTLLGAEAVRLRLDATQGHPPVDVHSVPGEWTPVIQNAGGAEERPGRVVSAPIRYGDSVLGRLAVHAPTRMGGEVSGIASQIGLAIHAARLLDHEASLAARYRVVDEMRRDFVALTTHELRTPITTIAGAAETLQIRGPDIGAEGREALLASITRQADRLIRLVDDLLTLGRSDAGQVSIHPQQVRIRDVAEIVVLSIPEHPIELVGPADLTGWLDPDRGVQILLNLVTNAFAHGTPPVTVRWSETPDAEQVRIEVVDSGPGIPAAGRERVFDRFVQLDPMSNHSRGTGLGLAISRDLARQMGGDVSIDATASTTTFVITFPASAPVVDVSDKVAPTRDDVTLRRG